jgi:tetratricopeptide (TPR) repeat protein
VDDADLRAVQARLALLIQRDRTSWPTGAGDWDRTLSDPLLARAEARLAAGDRAGALAALDEAAARQPDDPRIPFRRGELLAEERPREAIEAFERALALDPSVALVHYRLGEAHQRVGDRHTAVFHFEQAARHAAARGDLRRRAEAAILALNFPPVRAAGLADGERGARDADTPLGHSRARFDPSAAEVWWWAEIAERWVHRREHVRVRWTAPDGRVAAETPVRRERRPVVAARLPLPEDRRPQAGIWRVEALLDGRVIDRRTFHLVP